MFEYEYDLEGKTPLRVPVTLSFDDQLILNDFTDLIEARGVENEEDMGIGGIPSSRISKGILSAIRSAAIDLNHGRSSQTVELGAGMGAHLRDLLVEGIRLIPKDNWYEMAQAADAIVAKMILAYGVAISESTQSGDREEMKNVYRAGLGLPIILEQLKVDQCAIAAREAVAYAEVVGLKVRVEGESFSSDNEEELVTNVADALVRSKGSRPTIQFVDMKTGGRPNGQAGSIWINGLGTFSCSFTITFIKGRDELGDSDFHNSSALREALIKSGKLRLGVLNDSSVRHELIPYARYISRNLSRGDGAKVMDLIEDLAKTDPATSLKKLLARAMKAADPSAAFAQEAKAADNEYIAEFSRVLSLATSPATPLTKAEQALNDFADEMLKVRNSIG